MHGGAIIWGRDQWSIAEITSQMAIIYLYIYIYIYIYILNITVRVSLNTTQLIFQDLKTNN